MGPFWLCCSVTVSVQYNPNSPLTHPHTPFPHTLHVYTISLWLHVDSGVGFTPNAEFKNKKSRQLLEK